MDTKQILLVALIVFEIVMSSYLAYKDIRGAPKVCMLGHSCEDVQDSVYGKIFGIKLSYIAVFAFLALLATYFFNPLLFQIGTYIGGAGALILIILQIFVLKEICANCMIIDSTMLLILAASILWR